MSNKSKVPLFYSQLAKHYDAIYHYIDYAAQVTFFLKVIQKYKRTPNAALLDLCCGTGTHAALLRQAGFDVVGVDRSSEMLRQARKKDTKVKYIHADMQHLQLNDRFGVALCFFNSILYLTTKRELRRILQKVYQYLDRGGLFIFDMVDASIGDSGTRERYECKQKTQRIAFQPAWQRKGKHLHLDIRFMVDGKSICDHHVLGSYSIAEVRKLAAQVGFTVFVLKRAFARIEHYTGDTSAIFVCQKE